VVRLLATRGRRSLLVTRRPDGTGLDIPCSAVSAEGIGATLRELVVGAVGTRSPTRLLGYVRNSVSGPADGYPWPTPMAHFAVWRCVLPTGRQVPGTWLPYEDADAHLGERHWWPLALSVLGGG
jgi:hypothetical protein